MSRRSVLRAGVALALGATVGGCTTSSHRSVPTPPPPLPSGAPLLTDGPVVDVRALGAVGDGRTDDGDAIRRGLEAANSNGGTLYFPAGQYSYRATGPLRPAAGVTLAGVPGKSTVLFDFPGADGYVNLLSVVAAGVTVDGLILRRSAGFQAVLVGLGAVTHFQLSRTVLDGGMGSFPDAECHGIMLPGSGTVGNLRLSDSTLRYLAYGLFQTNASTATTSDVTVQRCSFAGNHNTSLEFNSPHGSTRGIQVDACQFSDTMVDGFGVGLAHVDEATVTNCTFDMHVIEGIHVEDHCNGVSLRGNRFTRCGLRDHSHVQVISGCTDVEILDNVFDASANTKRIYLVNALPGGTGPTPGGRQAVGPSNVLVRGNTFTCAKPVAAAYFQDVHGGSITGNTIDGKGLHNPGDAFVLLQDHGTSVDGNTINGRSY